MESNPQPVSPHLLRRYFYSGWAFFMPYLFFYLLYYWRKWPVNPLPPDNPGPGSHLPPLLHVYWALHVINVILGLLALRTWHQHSRLSALSSQPSVFQPFSFSAFLPWALLALLFYIPGVYLEFPSDPWEHLRRINDCANFQTFSLYKFTSYFLAYSLLGKIPADRQLLWLDFYYTGICLLLCWQYYRLARAVGLGARASLVFVILQAFLFGNNVFSFYRYYGLSSSIYAQLGAVALTRLGVEFAQQLPARPARWLETLSCAALLMPLTAFNHVQGLGIAVLGVSAVAIWRVLKWKPSAIWWLAATAVMVSVATLHWWPHHRSLDRIYQPSGWFTAWDGFNVLSPRSPAGDRALQIIGFLGVINLVAGLFLLSRNHVVGWLTVTPVLALALPFAAIPFAGALFKNGGMGGIITFHRMLFAVPPGLALICIGQGIVSRQARSLSAPRPFSPIFQPGLFSMVVFALLACTTIPASGPFYNKAWHALVKSPEDLNMRVVWADFDHYVGSPLYQANASFAATSGINIIMHVQNPAAVVY
jgi:hypothetical protein